MPEPLLFKFKYVNVSLSPPQEEGFFSKRGQVDGETLTLDGVQCPLAAVLRVIKRHGWLILAALQNDGSRIEVVLSVKGLKTDKVLLAINRGASAKWAELHLEALRKEGKGAQFRSVECRHCGCTLDLSDMPASPQVFCCFCDALMTLDGPAPTDEGQYRICDNCGFYAQPKDFTEFYFIFLFAAVIYRYKKVHICNGCMRKEVWKMFFANLLFVLGAPVALYQLVRAYFGGSALSPAFAGLDRANVLAGKLRTGDAVTLYAQIESRLPHCAGVRYSHGLALWKADRHSEAADQFLASLQTCSNFGPAYRMLCPALEKAGRTQELAALKKVYGDTQDANEEEKEA